MHVEDYVDMMLSMARAGKLTLKDMDEIMGFPSDEIKDESHALFEERIKDHPYLQGKMIIAERIEKLIQDYDNGLVVTAKMINADQYDNADDIMAILRHIRIE